MRRLLQGSALLLWAGCSGLCAATADDWMYQARVYAWTSALETSVDTPLGSIEADLDIGEVLSHLHMAFMGGFEARRGPWSLIGDAVYADLTATEDDPLRGAYAKASVESELGVLSGYAAYRVYHNAGLSADLVAGLRYVSLDNGLKLRAGVLPAATLGGDTSWTNPVIGARLRSEFNDRWYGAAFADFGDWGGDGSSWQVLASAGYRLREGFSVEAGYRHLDLEDEADHHTTGVELSGPMLGVNFRF